MPKTKEKTMNKSQVEEQRYESESGVSKAQTLASIQILIEYPLLDAQRPDPEIDE